MQDLEERLRQFAADRHRHQKLTADLEQIDVQLHRYELARARWEDTVEQTGDALRKLEGLGVAALFHAVLGDRRDKIDAEKEVLLRAKWKHDECDAAMEPLLAERRRIDHELRSIGDIAARHAELLQSKEQAMRERGGEPAERLQQSAGHLGLLASTLREIDEAVAVGQQAEAALEMALAELVQARGWGVVAMPGGGLLVASVKHGHIDAARSWAAKAQRFLEEFQREVRDVERTAPDLAIDIGGFEKFSDYFLDCLIFDWRVQTQIVDARHKVSSTLDRTRAAVWQLQRRHKDVSLLLESAHKDRAAWIEGAP